MHYWKVSAFECLLSCSKGHDVADRVFDRSSFHAFFLFLLWVGLKRTLTYWNSNLVRLSGKNIYGNFPYIFIYEQTVNKSEAWKEKNIFNNLWLFIFIIQRRRWSLFFGPRTFSRLPQIQSYFCFSFSVTTKQKNDDKSDADADGRASNPRPTFLFWVLLVVVTVGYHFSKFPDLQIAHSSGFPG